MNEASKKCDNTFEWLQMYIVTPYHSLYLSIIFPLSRRSVNNSTANAQRCLLGFRVSQHFVISFNSWQTSEVGLTQSFTWESSSGHLNRQRSCSMIQRKKVFETTTAVCGGYLCVFRLLLLFMLCFFTEWGDGHASFIHNIHRWPSTTI